MTFIFISFNCDFACDALTLLSMISGVGNSPWMHALHTAGMIKNTPPRPHFKVTVSAAARD